VRSNTYGDWGGVFQEVSQAIALATLHKCVSLFDVMVLKSNWYFRGYFQRSSAAVASAAALLYVGFLSVSIHCENLYR